MGRLGEGDRGTCCGQAPGGEKATKRHGRNSAQLQLWVQMHWHGGQGPGGCTAHPRGPRSPCPQGDGTGIPGLKYSQAERGPVPHGPGTLSAAAGLGGGRGRQTDASQGQWASPDQSVRAEGEGAVSLAASWPIILWDRALSCQVHREASVTFHTLPELSPGRTGCVLPSSPQATLCFCLLSVPTAPSVLRCPPSHQPHYLCHYPEAATTSSSCPISGPWFPH